MNEEMAGLSQRSQKQPTLEEVVELLKQGVEPEELLKYGIPPEMVQAAMKSLMGSIQNPSSEGMGLANSVIQPLK